MFHDVRTSPCDVAGLPPSIGALAMISPEQDARPIVAGT